MKKIIFFWLLAVTGLSSKAQTKGDSRPNFIIIYSDDQRQDGLGINGNRVLQTPLLDRMAQEAIQFTNANVVFSLCSPSRAALLTGRYGSANGVLHLGSALRREEKTIAGYLKEAGYQTAVSGKWHIKQRPQDVGFDFHAFFEGNGAYYGRLIHDMGKDVKPQKHCDEYCADRSIDFLQQAVQQNQPFFLFHCTQLPHMNGELKWDAKEETLARYQAADMPVAKSSTDDLSGKPDYLKRVRNRTQASQYGYPAAGAIQQHTKAYYAVLSEMDEALGRLFKTIDTLGLRKNTYIIFMSDNGWLLGEHGFTSKVLPYRPSTRVPLFILGPGLSPRLEDEIALNIDVTPTVLDLAGIQIPANLHGKSLVPLLTGKTDRVRTSFVYEGLGNYGGAKPNLTVVSKQYRYIETYADESLQKIAFQELYDQMKDPDEMINLANDKIYKKKINQFRRLIQEHQAKILKQ